MNYFCINEMYRKSILNSDFMKILFGLLKSKDKNIQFSALEFIYEYMENKEIEILLNNIKIINLLVNLFENSDEDNIVSQYVIKIIQKMLSKSPKIYGKTLCKSEILLRFDKENFNKLPIKRIISEIKLYSKIYK